jgi:uncharacterized protein (TIGR03067 family)
MTDSIKEEKRKLQGIWTVQSVDTGSKSLSLFEAAAKGGKLVFEGDDVIFKGDKSTRMNYKIGLDSKLKTIDFILEKDRVLKAIYELDADVLKMCWGSRRPTEFKAKRVSGLEGQVLIILKREKS